jgi:hypothetical protein
MSGQTALTGSIPASAFVNVLPGVLGAGGNGIVLNGLFLTNSIRVPIGAVYSFPTAPAVGAFFGLSSPEVAQANVYFNGYNGATQQPGAMLFAQYPSVAVAANLRGGAVSGLSLTQLQAISGTLSIDINGTVESGTINLTAATSFSSAAGIIATDLSLPAATVASFTGSISGTTLTVSESASGLIAAGQTLAGSGVTAGTTIVSQLTGTNGGAGTYQVSASQTVASEALTTTLPAVFFDSVSGSFVLVSSTTGTASTIALATGTAAASLGLTAATGAVLSQGAAAGVPAAFMAGIIAVTQNWAGFTTIFNPDGATGLNAVKFAFAQWASSTNNRYAYVPWDGDIEATEQDNTENLGFLIQQASLTGVLPVYDPNNQGLAAFVLGYAASLNFDTPNGRTTLAYRSQAGLVATVTDQTIMNTLIGYGYSMYVAVATAAQDFTYFWNGAISGPFLWADSFFNQIWLNAQVQLALLELETAINSIPYNVVGDSLVRTTLIGTPQEPGPIDQAITFGAIVAGTTLSAMQANAINQATGVNAAQVVASQGYYLFIGQPSPQVQQARGTRPMILYYADGESMQQMTLSSTDVL